MATKQYPHFLFAHITPESSKNEDGSWWTPEAAWVLVSVCREETNGAGRTIIGVDGKAIVYSSSIYLPKGVQRIAEGTEILVSETNDVDGICRIKGSLLKHDVGQLHGRLWV